MSGNEKLFLQEMRRTLLRIFVPVAVAIILAAGSFAIAAPFRIKAIEEKTDAIEKSYVTNTMMTLYLNQLREANSVMRQSLESDKEFNKEEFTRINKRMDDLIREMVPHNTRGGIPEI